MLGICHFEGNVDISKILALIFSCLKSFMKRFCLRSGVAENGQLLVLVC